MVKALSIEDHTDGYIEAAIPSSVFLVKNKVLQSEPIRLLAKTVVQVLSDDTTFHAEQSAVSRTYIIALRSDSEKYVIIKFTYVHYEQKVNVFIRLSEKFRLDRHPSRNYELLGKIITAIDSRLFNMLPKARRIPAGSEDAISRDDIKDGDILVDFDNEYSFGRYYLESTFKHLNGKNPYTKGMIDPSTIRAYIAQIVESGKGRKTRKRKHSRRKTHTRKYL
jgi:hypothetical protein